MFVRMSFLAAIFLARGIYCRLDSVAWLRLTSHGVVSVTARQVLAQGCGQGPGAAESSLNPPAQAPITAGCQPVVRVQQKRLTRRFSGGGVTPAMKCHMIRIAQTRQQFLQSVPELLPDRVLGQIQVVIGPAVGALHQQAEMVRSIRFVGIHGQPADRRLLHTGGVKA